MGVVTTSMEIAKEIESMLLTLGEEPFENLVGLFLQRDTVFFAGAGRSGLMLRAAAMRFMHMGYHSYFTGETSTPAIQNGNVLVIGSASGETASLIVKASKAKSLGAVVVVFTIFPESSVGKLADLVVRIPATTLKSAANSGGRSIQPAGSLFEQCMLISMEALVMELMERKGLVFENMFKRHANLE